MSKVIKQEFRHFRLTVENAVLTRWRLGFRVGRTPSPRGGATVCILTDELGQVLATGWAWCSPVDQFSYKLGRRISAGRAEARLAGRAVRNVIPKWLSLESLLWNNAPVYNRLYLGPVNPSGGMYSDSRRGGSI